MNFEELIVLVDAAVYRQYQKHLRDIDVLVLRESLDQKGYDQIAEAHNYTGQYLRQDVGPKLWRTLSTVLGTKIGKKNCNTVLKSFWQQNIDLQKEVINRSDPISPSPTHIPSAPVNAATTCQLPIQTKISWGAMASAGAFYGREQELETLKNWIIGDRCRLLSIIGMGGMGKTSLVIQLTEQIAADFEFVMVQSVRNAPSLSGILTQFFNFVGAEAPDHPLSISDTIQAFIQFCQKFRCLLILDNFETLLQEKTRVGEFCPNYEDYGEFLQAVADYTHQSCLILTSRELPKNMGLRTGLNSPVQTLKLSGLDVSAAKLILKHKGIHTFDPICIQEVLHHYGGNPLALKIVASGIVELCEGDLTRLMPYLERGLLQFEDIDDLLGRHFQRLDDIERQVMYWLAIHRDPVSLPQLEQDILRFNILRQLPRAVQSLYRRNLVERNSAGLFLQPVVMEYIRQRLLENLTEEIIQSQYASLQTYALLTPHAQDTIQKAQTRFILDPLLAALQDQFMSPENIQEHLIKILARLRQETPKLPSYACGNLLNLIRQLTGSLDSLDCSNLCVWEANFVGTSAQKVDLRDADVSRSSFCSALSTTLAVTFSPNGQFFATGNADNDIRVWTVQDCKEYRTLQGHQHWVSTVTFCEDSQFLMSGSFDKTIKIWDLETGVCLNTLQGHTAWIWAVTCNPHDAIIASCGDDHTIRLWDRQTGECLKILDHGNGAVWSLAFSPDGTLLASASSDVEAPVKLWNWRTGEAQNLVPENLQRRVRSVAFSPDGQWLATGSLACITEIWDVASGTCIQQLRGHSQPVTSVAFSSAASEDQRCLLATASQDCSLRLWDAKTGESLHTLKGHPNGIWSLAFHPTQSLLVSGSNDSTVKLWNTETGESLRTIQGYSTGIKAIALNPNGQQLASAGDSSTIQLWDYPQPQRQETLWGHSSWVWCLKYTNDGQGLLSCGNDNLIKLWNTQSGEVIHTLRGHRSLIFDLALHTDSHLLASASDDHCIKLWDLMTGQCLDTLIHSGRVWSVDFSPNGKSLASGNCESLISLWDVESRQCIQRLEGHHSLVWAIAFSPKGDVLASGSDDQTVKLWNTQTWECCYTLTGHQGSIWAVDFSPNGKWLATGSNDTTLRIWQVSTGELHTTLYGHQSAIWDLVFADDNTVISAAQEGCLKVWNLETSACTATFQAPRPYEGMNLTGATGLTDAQRISLSTLGAIV